MTKRNPLVAFVGYGGGHMRMLVPVARQMVARGVDVLLLPLTIGAREAAASGLPMKTQGEVAASLPDADRIEALGRSVVSGSSHPDVTDQDSYAYHGLGMRDLIGAMGEAEARAAWSRDGRRVFHPVKGWSEILAGIKPDLLVATCAPRSESAALAAARDLSIPSVCVTDHFLVYEIGYVARPGHGDRITVLGHGIKRHLAEHGRPEGEIVVTGNPAFDRLAAPQLRELAAGWRQDVGWDSRRIVLWPQESGDRQVGGKPLVPSVRIAGVLEQILAADPDLRLAVRRHPSAADGWTPPETDRIRLAEQHPIEAMVHAADLVVQQATTVGVQAALLGKPVITIANKGMPPLAEYGLAEDIAGPSDLGPAIARATPPDPAGLGADRPGGAASRVADLIQELLAGGV